MEDAPPSGREISRRAWSSALAAFVSMKSLFVSAIFSQVLVAVLFFYIPSWLPTGQSYFAKVAASLGVLFSETLLQTLIAAPVAVAIHRFILLDRRTSGIISLWPSYTRLFFLWLFGFYTVGIVAGFAEGSAILLWPRVQIFFWIANIVLWVFGVLSLLIFPAVATEVSSSGFRQRLETSWEEMSKPFWTYVWAIIVTGFPVVFSFAIFKVIWSAVTNYLFYDMKPYGPFALTLDVADKLVDLIIVVLGAAVASWLYASIRQRPAGD